MMEYVENTPFEQEMQKQNTALYNKLIESLELVKYYKILTKKQEEIINVSKEIEEEYKHLLKTYLGSFK